MAKTLRVAVAQAAYAGRDRALNQEKAFRLVRLAKERGADIVLFPECWLQGYTFPLLEPGIPEDSLYSRDHYGASMETVMQNPAYQEWAAAAVQPDGAETAAFCKLAGSLSIGIVLTCFTKGRRRPRNSAILIDKSGKVLMQYDKVHTCDFSAECLLESGEEFKVCDFDGVKIGVMICYDREYPESARMLMLKGAEVILVPNCCGAMKNRVGAIRTRAYENMAAIAMANPPGENGGLSCAFDPRPWDDAGRDLDMTVFLANSTTEDLYLAEFDLDALRAYRASEMMGNTFRKPTAYRGLESPRVEPPFIRRRWLDPPADGKEGAPQGKD